jgi:hypothetical protein
MNTQSDKSVAGKYKELGPKWVVLLGVLWAALVIYARAPGWLDSLSAAVYDPVPIACEACNGYIVPNEGKVFYVFSFSNHGPPLTGVHVQVMRAADKSVLTSWDRPASPSGEGFKLKAYNDQLNTDGLVYVVVSAPHYRAAKYPFTLQTSGFTFHEHNGPDPYP